MSEPDASDLAPGDEHGAGTSRTVTYLVGLGLAAALTFVSFYLAGGHSLLFWGPSIPVALVVLAIAQMGVHLVFFIHLTSDPDNTNNTLALAFGLLIVILVVGGSLFIMSNLNHNMMPMNVIMQMQR